MPAIYRNKKRGGAWTFPLFRYMVSLFKQHQNVHFVDAIIENTDHTRIHKETQKNRSINNMLM